MRDAFSYDTINKNVLEKAAKRFKYRYDILYGAKFDAIENGNEEEYANEAWLKRRKVYLEETDAVKRKEKKLSNNKKIDLISKLARESGMSYGKYVAMQSMKPLERK